jgi:aspartyl-tRNA(Asn)/glutamyl-tRNA(Gln) amidotransferase subunit B
LIITDEMIEKYSDIPELPDAKKARFVKDFGLKAYDAGVICSTKQNADYFEEMLSSGISGKMATTWLTVELQGRFTEGQSVSNSPVSATKLGELIKAIEDGTISGKAGKEVLDYLMENDASIDTVVEKLGLKQVSDDGALLTMIDEILSNNQDKVAEYKSGKEKMFAFFVGQTMKASKGSANPQKVSELLKERLN